MRRKKIAWGKYFGEDLQTCNQDSLQENQPSRPRWVPWLFCRGPCGPREGRLRRCGGQGDHCSATARCPSTQHLGGPGGGTLPTPTDPVEKPRLVGGTETPKNVRMADAGEPLTRKANLNKYLSGYRSPSILTNRAMQIEAGWSRIFFGTQKWCLMWGDTFSQSFNYLGHLTRLNLSVNFFQFLAIVPKFL